MKKEYIKPIIINIKICNDDALCEIVTASLFHYGQADSEENIADGDDEDNEDNKPFIDNGTIWND